MPKAKGPRKINRYGDDFKARAVKLGQVPGVQVKDVAEALDIHPFMLSKWRKQVREGLIVAKGEVEIDPAVRAFGVGPAQVPVTATKIPHFRGRFWA